MKYTLPDPNTVTECVSQEELDAVERKVDELYSQLHYWQNVTINILKEQYFPSNPGIYTDHESGLHSGSLSLLSQVQSVNVVIWRHWSLLFSISLRVVSVVVDREKAWPFFI